jgi:ankyrin repeat protein
MSPLFEAIRGGDLAGVRSSLDADPGCANEKNEQGVSAFAFAIYNRKSDVAELLESRGADLDVFAAAMGGRIERLREMIEGNKSLAKLVAADGWTALHLAAFFGHPEAVRILLRAGADVNARSTNAVRNQPLHAGAAGRSWEVVKLLVEAGADVNATQGGGFTPLHAAAQNGDLEIAALLLQSGASPNPRADNQQLPLDLALVKGRSDMVALLERHGAKL